MKGFKQVPKHVAGIIWDMMYPVVYGRNLYPPY